MSSISVESKDSSKPPEFHQDFGVSPFYWEQNNPSALFKNEHDRLAMFYEDYSDDANELLQNTTDFETQIIGTPREIKVFRKFLADGKKFGCTNVSNAGCRHFSLLKEMYGSFVYLVFENKALDRNDPRLKHQRSVLFFDEYSLCIANIRFFKSNEEYFDLVSAEHGIVSSFERLMAKLFRNGFYLDDSNPWQYAEEKYPMPEYYYSNEKREKLDSSDLVSLLWKAIADSRIDADTQYIVGFGWLPCLLAKEKLNELDRFVLEEFYSKSSELFSKTRRTNAVSENFADVYGSQDLLEIETQMDDNRTKVVEIPLRKVLSIEEKRDSGYIVSDVDGNRYPTASLPKRVKVRSLSDKAV